MILYALGLLMNLVINVAAHGLVTYPRTRELSNGMTIYEANTPNHADQLHAASGPITVLKPGKQYIHLQFNAGALHPGPCTLTLLDLQGNKIMLLATVYDCAQSIVKPDGSHGFDAPAEMMFDLPFLPQCVNHCLLKWHLSATHLSTVYPEMYDNYMDIAISNNGTIVPPNPVRKAKRCLYDGCQGEIDLLPGTFTG
jgi:hypothetical protein